MLIYRFSEWFSSTRTLTWCTLMWWHFFGSDLDKQAGKSWADHFCPAARSNCWVKTKCPGSWLYFLLFALIWNASSWISFKCNILRQSIRANRNVCFSGGVFVTVSQNLCCADFTAQPVSVLDVSSQSWLCFSTVVLIIEHRQLLLDKQQSGLLQLTLV